MLSRRTFCALAAGAFAAPRLAWGQDNKQEKGKPMMSAKLLLCEPRAGVAALSDRPGKGDVDAGRRGEAAGEGSVRLAASTAPFLYVASSEGGSSSLGIKGTRHYLSALQIDKGSGELQMHGPSASLRSRPDPRQCRSLRPFRAGRLQQSEQRHGSSDQCRRHRGRGGRAGRDARLRDLRAPDPRDAR